MSSPPNFKDIYDEMKNKVISDSSSELDDFSDGSVLDVIVGVLSIVAMTIIRWISLKIASVFLLTSKGDDLDALVLDRYGSGYENFLLRKSGEKDDDLYLSRVLLYVENLSRATLPSISFYLKNIRTDLDPSTVVVTEDLDTGIINVRATILNENEIDIFESVQNIMAGLAFWRPACHHVNLVLNNGVWPIIEFENVESDEISEALADSFIFNPFQGF